MTPVEAIIDALRSTADRHEANARAAAPLIGTSDGYRVEAIADRRIADALRDVAQEFALALGVQS
jgi:hypothetical protein